MGTYDTRGGHPVSPSEPEPYVSPLVEEVLGLLEDKGVGESFCDRIAKILEEYEADQACAADERRLSGR